MVGLNVREGLYVVCVWLITVALAAITLPTIYPGHDHACYLTYFAEGKDREQGGFNVVVRDDLNSVSIDFFCGVNSRLLISNYTKAPIRQPCVRVNETHWEVKVWPLTVCKGDTVYFWFVFLYKPNGTDGKLLTSRSHFTYIRLHT